MPMTQRVINYAIALYELTSDKEAVALLRTMMEETEVLSQVLANPMISKKKKHRIIDGLSEQAALPAVLKNFMKYITDHGDSALLMDIVKEYDSLWEKKHHILNAQLLYAQYPEEAEIKQAEEFLQKQYPDMVIHTSISVQKNLLGGLCIRIGNTEYDWSYEGRLQQLERMLTER